MLKLKGLLTFIGCQHENKLYFYFILAYNYSKLNKLTNLLETIMSNVFDVYLNPRHYNAGLGCMVPGAWVAVIENDYLGEIAQPFANSDMYSTTEEAMSAAKIHFNPLIKR